MSIIDDRGRVFGRVNLVDAAIIAVVLLLLPAGYLSYLLFRDPAPRLTAIVPDKLHQGPNLQIEVRGENFRPYMRVSIGDLQGRTFLFNNPTDAIVQLPDVPPGKYDVVLYDYMQEVSRLRQALVIDPPPLPPMLTVDVRGALTSLTPEAAREVVVGHKFPETGPPVAEVISVGSPEPAVVHVKAGDANVLTVHLDNAVEVPVHLRIRCFVQIGSDGMTRCAVAGVPLAPDANVQFPGFGSTMNLRVAEVHYASEPRRLVAVVRFVMTPEVRAKLAARDQDVGARAFPAGEMATIVSLSDRGDAPAAAVHDDRVRQAIPSSRLLAVDARIEVPVEQTPLGWTYKSALIKVGSPFTFETAEYVVSGGITDVIGPAR
jgi:hypothetical protein